MAPDDRVAGLDPLPGQRQLDLGLRLVDRVENGVVGHAALDPASPGEVLEHAVDPEGCHEPRLAEDHLLVCLGDTDSCIRNRDQPSPMKTPTEKKSESFQC